MKPRMILFFVAFIVWCLFSWVPDGAHLFVGIFVATIVTYLLGDIVFPHPYVSWRPHRLVYFLFHYVPVLVWEVLKANIDVAYRVVHPQLPIRPGIVKVSTSLQSDIALTLLANSITLTPGTMSVDIDQENTVLYVHWINVHARDSEAATKIIVERFERILRRIFEEE